MHSRALFLVGRARFKLETNGLKERILLINSIYDICIEDSTRDLIAKKHMMSAAIKKHPIFKNLYAIAPPAHPNEKRSTTSSLTQHKRIGVTLL